MPREEPPTDAHGTNGVIRLRYVAGEKVKLLRIYVLTSNYPDGRLADVTIKAGLAGSTISGLLNALSLTASLAIQHGVPLEALLGEWLNLRFEPEGTTADKTMPRVGSIVDATARYLAHRYLAHLTPPP